MELEQQFLKLLSIVEDLHKKVNQLEQENQRLIRSQKQLLEWTKQNQQEYLHFQENIQYELRDAVQKDFVQKTDIGMRGEILQKTAPQKKALWKSECFFPKILRGEAAIKAIISEGKSLARFGDGEFSVMAGRVRHSFQTQTDERLKERLIEVLQSQEENLLVGIADNYGSLEKYTSQAKREIRCYLNPQVRREHMELLSPDRTYYDAYVTRPYVMYADNQTDAPGKRFEQLKKIWENRRCVFVEGCYTRLGVGNDLFANAAEIQRILGPAKNAFSKYQEIFDYCRKQPKDTLFLLALGPAATVLAYDLCRVGYQAVDIGHADLEYEWFLRGEGRRTEVEGKYNNELPTEQQFFDVEDKNYRKQTIADFS